MQVTVRGTRDRKFASVMRKAARSFASNLFGHKMLPHLTFRIICTHELSASGFCGPSDIADLSRPRDFEIELLNKDRTRLSIITTLAHEMVHAKQFAYGQLKDKVVKRKFVTTWHGVPYDDEVDYWDHPWEIEAYGLENSLVAKFLQASNLYDFFETEAGTWYPQPKD